MVVSTAAPETMSRATIRRARFQRILAAMGVPPPYLVGRGAGRLLRPGRDAPPRTGIRGDSVAKTHFTAPVVASRTTSVPPMRRNRASHLPGERGAAAPSAGNGAAGML